MGSSVLPTTFRAPRAWLAALYLMVAAGAIVLPAGPRVFWTVLMPLVPIGFVLAGFSAWRRICPLAALASLGRAAERPARRLPRWIARRPMSASLALLVLGLWIRLVAVNGDGVALGVMLLVIGALAIAVNRAYSGKSWCNALCPVGVVERIYTDAGALREPAASSRCARCTGCVRACPDIDPEKSYEGTFDTSDRRAATYAFPGVVLAFYTYFRLREGTWAAFFDGRWTARPADLELLAGPGLLWVPEVPAWAAAAAALLGGACASFAIFAAAERVLAQRFDAGLVRHRVLAVAAFAAFNAFYVFAGAPSLALVPGARRIVAFVVPVVATLVLVRRFARAHPRTEKRRLTVLPR